MNIRICKRAAIFMGFATAPIFLDMTPVYAEALTAPSSESETATSTAANDLATPTSAQTITDTAATEDLVAQTVTPGRATRSGPSYIGVGGNIGFGGDTALGESNFTIYSKVELTNRLSARPGVVIGSDPTVLLPLTADFPIAPVSEDVDFDVAPFVGGGVAISTGSDSLVRPMITGGVDIPVADRVTVTAQGNVLFLRDAEGSVILGVGYNF
jgi:hypothetical protein